MTIREIIELAENKLADANKDVNTAKLFMLHLFDNQSVKLITKLDEKLDEEMCDKYLFAIDQLIKGIPLQHLTGVQSFFGRDFIVNNQVLIPRYETEELVENILYIIDDFFNENKNIVVADIGTGSGAIAISLKAEEPKCEVFATDISSSALLVAKQNANKFNVEINFKQGDMLDPIINQNIKLDLLVSNPPYIKREETIDAIVKDNEPHLALFGGDNGLYFYQKILSKAHLVLKNRAILAFEIGYDLKNSLSTLVEHYLPNCEFEFKKDIYGNDRMLFIYYNSAFTNN